MRDRDHTTAKDGKSNGCESLPMSFSWVGPRMTTVTKEEGDSRAAELRIICEEITFSFSQPAAGAAGAAAATLLLLLLLLFLLDFHPSQVSCSRHISVQHLEKCFKYNMHARRAGSIRPVSLSPTSTGVERSCVTRSRSRSRSLSGSSVVLSQRSTCAALTEQASGRP
mmetsp:Transcript_73055/g.159784  ORF Transcript_73055/g.159784 Transcript_73055/m.159784 type:complete len:168 (+) Transcript_73055:199-702(+)